MAVRSIEAASASDGRLSEALGDFRERHVSEGRVINQKRHYVLVGVKG